MRIAGLIFLAAALLFAQTKPLHYSAGSIQVSAQPPEISYPVAFKANPPSPELTEFHWWFGDRTEGEGPDVTHYFTASGTFHVHLRAMSADGRQQNSSDMLVKVGTPLEFSVPEETKP